MSALPEGTVTVLFSDIEGSTSLVSALGEHWAETLTVQRRLLRAVWTAHRGNEMGTEGDSFFVVFASAHDAVLAAVEGQRVLQLQEWPLGAQVRVRMGLHTGEPERHEEGYVGLDVHRGARISSTAHGGQVVLSAATAQLVPDLTDRLQLRDLGWHRLKDLDAPEHLYDLVVPGLADEFPPLRSLGTQANLPRPTTELVGRDDEVTELQLLLSRDDTRLVTVTGPGGTGKTRLALATASRLAGQLPSVFFVGLSSATDADSMWAGIAQAVGAGGSARQSPRERVTAVLGSRTGLLVLDNLEQIADADNVVAQLMTECPDLRLLVTSRRPLHLVAEHEWPLEPLQLPRTGADPETALRSEAVRLFCARAELVRPSFALTDDNVADVVAICQHLDGLPLALELAAARLRLLTPRALLARLDDSLGSGPGARDRPERQRTLRATIEWSHELLGEEDRTVFARLSAFVSGCGLDALEYVIGGDVDALGAVTRLVDASLVRVVDGADDEPTLLMLQTVRAYARDQLEASPDAAGVLDRHAEWFADLSDQLHDQLKGPAPLPAIDAIDAALPDIRAALNHTLQPGNPERIRLGARLVRSIGWYWYRHRFAVEAQYWHERLLSVLDDESDDMVQSLHGVALSLLGQQEHEPAIGMLERALAIARRLGDPATIARELNSLGLALHESGDIDRAQTLLRESIQLAREAGTPTRVSTALANLAVLLVERGEYDEALRLSAESMQLDSAAGDRWGIAVNEVNRLVALRHVDGAAAAHEHLCEAAPWIIELGDDDLVAIVLELFVYALAELGEMHRAARMAGAAADFRADQKIVPTVSERRLLEEAVAKARAGLSATDWEAEFAAGATLDVPAALALAAAVPGDPSERKDRLGQAAATTSPSAAGATGTGTGSEASESLRWSRTPLS